MVNGCTCGRCEEMLADALVDAKIARLEADRRVASGLR
jgi:hypothetical protein